VGPHEPFYDPDFVELLGQWNKTLNRHSYDSLPGMTVSETKTEMMQCLYRAYEDHKPMSGTPFSAYFWLIWRRHRASYLRWFFRIKRGADVELLKDPVDMRSYEHNAALVPDIGNSLQPEIPVIGLHDREEHVWVMLCAGFSATEIMSMLRMNTHTYYMLIRKWKEAMPDDYLRQ
jgi:hypothetical protein